MTELPDPLTPADCDLRGMPYMPLDLVRLFDSDLYVLSNGEEFKAALTLWGKSFYQLPAGSLPDDDRLLEHLSGSKRWKAVKEMALRGWVKCSDGRLYHNTVAEKVQEAWASRLARRARTEAARAARHNAQSSSDSSNSPPFTSPVTDNATASVTELVTESKGTEQNRTEGNGREKRKKGEEAAADASTSTPLKRATRLPFDWQPCPDDRTFALSLGLNVQLVAASFRDFWNAKAGKDATKLDWSATWRNWCRREKPVMPVGRPAVTSARDMSIDQNETRLAELRRQFSDAPDGDFFTGQTIEGRSFDA